MTDREFKRLNRSQLIDIIYRLQLEMDELKEQKQALEKELADKRLRLSKAGNIADAALEMNDCLRSAQNAAEQYLAEIQALRDEAELESRRILSLAKEEAAKIVADAKKTYADYDSAIAAIIEEYGQDQSDNG